MDEISAEMMAEKERIIEEQSRLLEENALKAKDEAEKQAILEKEKIKKHSQKKDAAVKLLEQSDALYNISKEKIEKHIEAYEDTFDRKPLADELIENLGDEISDEHMTRFLETYVTDAIPPQGEDNV